MAEALFLRAASIAGRHDNVISRGTMTDPGSAEPIGQKWPSAQVMMQYYGIDISQHMPKAVSVEDIAWADLILAMTKHQVVELRQMFGDRLDLRLDHKLHTFGNYLGLSGSNVEDPVGKGYSVYLSCAKQLELWTKLLVEKLNSHDIKTHA
jgi:protein-tyrosine-phosphatase